MVGRLVTSISALLFLLHLACPAPGEARLGRSASMIGTKQHQILSVPLAFEENTGRYDRRVRFVTRIPGATVFVTSTEVAMVLRPKSNDRSIARPDTTASERDHVLKMKLRGASPNATAAGLDRLPGTTSYYIGSDPANWRTRVPMYAKAKLSRVYSGIDVVYYGTESESTSPSMLEYDFVVSPGADPHQIGLEFDGSDELSLVDGGLVAKTPAGEVRLRRPYAYQTRNERQVEVAAKYRVTGNRVGLEIAQYDPMLPLVIDPVLEYSTYLGGTGYEHTHHLFVDAAGNVYVTGRTTSTNFPVTPGAVQPESAGSFDVFVTKLDPTGSTVLFSSFIGGGDIDGEFGAALTVDATGSAYVLGSTRSADFPVTPGAFQQAHRGGREDMFVLKLDPSGNTLLYSTYLGGSGSEETSQGIAVDDVGCAFVTGMTASGDFPVTGGVFDSTHSGGRDAFVTKFNASGSALLFSTFLGGTGDDGGAGLLLTDAGVLVAGHTYSSDFPTTEGAYDRSHNGNRDFFVVILDPTGSSVLASSFMGGTSEETSHGGLGVDASGNVYAGGTTRSSDCPTTQSALQPSYGGGTYDAYVFKLSPDLRYLLWATYFGSYEHDWGSDLAADHDGNVYLTGTTRSNNLPTTSDALDATFNGGSGAHPNDAYLAVLRSDAPMLLYCTYIGGGDNDGSYGVALDAARSIYVTGGTSSADFPVVPGSYDTVFHGDLDAFLLKVRAVTATDTTPPETVALVSPAANASGWNNGPVSVTLSAQDTESGVASTSYKLGDAVLAYTRPIVVADDGVHTVAFWSTDVAGNVEDAKSITVKVDSTPPVIALTSPEAKTYLINEAVTAVYSATDTLSGIASCTGPVASGSTIDTTVPGSYTFIVAAEDNAGNLAATTVSYAVGYRLVALYDQEKVHKSGCTIPIKVRIEDANGANLSSPDIVVTAVEKYWIDGDVAGEPEDSGNANPDLNFRYTDGTYLFNLSTKGYQSGTWELRVRVAGDPTTHSVRFKIRQ